MANTTETIMSAKDYLEIAFGVINLVILGVTVYYIKTSPIKAVKIGRKLNDEQNKYEAKSKLFLTLFSFRGNPTNYDFVNGLNQIDVVFGDEQAVLDAWKALYNLLNTSNQIDHDQHRLSITKLLSEMAKSLGYQKLEQTEILKNYFPRAHADQNNENLNFNQAAKKFFETGTKLYEINIATFEKMNEDNKNK